MKHEDNSFLEPIIPEVVEEEDEEARLFSEEDTTDEKVEPTVGKFYKVLDAVLFPLMKRVFYY